MVVQIVFDDDYDKFFSIYNDTTQICEIIRITYIRHLLVHKMQKHKWFKIDAAIKICCLPKYSYLSLDAQFCGTKGWAKAWRNNWDS